MDCVTGILLMYILKTQNVEVSTALITLDCYKHYKILKRQFKLSQRKLDLLESVTTKQAHKVSITIMKATYLCSPSNGLHLPRYFRLTLYGQGWLVSWYKSNLLNNYPLNNMFLV